MVDTCVCLSVFTLLVLTTWSHARASPSTPDHNLMRDLDDVGAKLRDAVRSVQRFRKSLDDEVSSCRVTTGSQGCVTRNIDIIKHLITTLQNHHNPGKRSVRSIMDGSPLQQSYMDDVLRKREVMGRLQSTLTDILHAIHNEKKRSCQLNLGFHCQTEDYSAVADNYNYLLSAMSPGKRK